MKFPTFRLDPSRSYIKIRHYRHPCWHKVGHVLRFGVIDVQRTSMFHSPSLLCKNVYIFLKCASHLDSPAAMGVPQRRQQVRRRPEILSSSMMKWYRFTQTGCPLQPATKQTNQTQDSIADAVLYVTVVCDNSINHSNGCCALKATT